MCEQAKKKITITFTVLEHITEDQLHEFLCKHIHEGIVQEETMDTDPPMTLLEVQVAIADIE